MAHGHMAVGGDAGKSDPFVEIFTTNDHRCVTKVIKSNLAPVWDEVRAANTTRGDGQRSSFAGGGWGGDQGRKQLVVCFVQLPSCQWFSGNVLPHYLRCYFRL
jgi:hypothetical protein